MLILLLFTVGCSSCPQVINRDSLIIKAIPAFPAPHKDTVKELSTVCKGNDCSRLYEWLGKLMIFEKQLKVVKTQDKP